jgi:hypothetical protein
MPELDVSNMPLPDEAPKTEPTKSDAEPAPKQSETPEYTPLEQEMMAQGWKPRDQFEGEDDDFVSAAEYKRRGELFKKIADTNRRLERTNATLTALQQHQKQMYEAGYANAIKELKAQHAAAVEDGDREAATEILEKIENTSQAQAQVRAMRVAPPEPPVAMNEFMERNASWYQKDELMTVYADGIGHKFAQAEIQQGRQPTVDSVLAHVEQKVREKFPNAFDRKRGSQPPPVGPAASPARVPVKSKGFSSADLSDMERSAMRGFIRDGVMTEEEYLADIKKIRGIK